MHLMFLHVLMAWELICFNYWLILHCMDVPPFIYLFTCWSDECDGPRWNVKNSSSEKHPVLLPFLASNRVPDQPTPWEEMGMLYLCTSGSLSLVCLQMIFAWLWECQGLELTYRPLNNWVPSGGTTTKTHEANSYLSGHLRTYTK